MIKAFLAAFCPHCPHLSSSIPPGICPHCLRHFLAISIRQYPQLATRHSVALPHYFHVTLTQDFPATFIWNVDLPSQGIVRQVGDPNGSISLPSAQPTCPTDMRGWWVGVQMIVTSLMNYLQALPCGILPALLPRFSRDIATSFSRDIHLERGPALSGHCEAGGLSQWKHFPSICTANMPHRYAWLVGGCADDCHEPDEISVQYFVLLRNLLPNNTIFVTTATIGRLCI